MKKFLAFMGLVIIAFTFAGCGDSLDPAALTYEKVTDKDLAVEFEKPTGWYENVDSETDPDLYQFIVPNQFSQTDRVEGFLAVYKIAADEGNDVSIDDAYKLIKDSKVSLSQDKEGYEVVTDGKDATIFGMPAKEMVVKYSVAAQDDKVLTFDSVAVVLVGKSTYLVEFYDEEGDYNKYMPVKEKLYSTLKAL